MEKETVSITLSGLIPRDNDNWINWYEDSKNIVNFLGYSVTHIGIESTSLHSGKVLSIKRSEKKVLKSIQNGDKIEYISLYSLPDEYSSASFDYNVLLARECGYLTIIINKSDYDDEKKRCILNILKKYFDSASYEVYEMDRKECPLLYASKDNPASFFETLNIIETGVIR